MHPWHPIAIVGTAFAALSMPFPFATLPVLGVLNGIEADAWPSLIPLLPLVLFASMGDWGRGLRPTAAIAVIVPACLAVIFAVAKLADAVLAVRATTGASMGAGAFVLLGGTLIALGGAAAALSRV